jgi:transcriptional regulator with XRE-family HTH domain
MGQVLHFADSLRSRRRLQQVLVQPLQRGEPRVFDVPVDELGKPRMADIRLFRDARPVALPCHQSCADLLVEDDFHAPRIAKDCYSSKQPIARHSPSMTKNSTVTETLATNLRHFMSQKGMVQTDLAKATGLGQTTISLYLNPESRKDTNKGAPPSPSLARVQLLADALDVELWELLRPLTQAQRDLIRSIDAVIAEKMPKPKLAATAPPEAPPVPGTSIDAPIKKGGRRERHTNR